jgi:hypothetical protein
MKHAAHPVRAWEWDPKAPEPIWYGNPYAIRFREWIAPGASVTIHPHWGTQTGFDAFHPCSFFVQPDGAEHFLIVRLTFEGWPQWLGLDHGPCPATLFSTGDLRGAALYETCAFGGSIDLRVRNEWTKPLRFVATLSGPMRVAQSVVDEVARADWSALTKQQRRAILHHGEQLDGGLPRKEENKKTMDESLIALGLIAPFHRGGCLPTARGLALADYLYRGARK